MNVLKSSFRTTVKTLLERGVSQREIQRKTGIHRRTIRRYCRLFDLAVAENNADSNCPTLEGVATGSGAVGGQNAPPRPPALEGLPQHARSACEPHRGWIEEQLRLGRNAMAIYQDLVERWAFGHRYNSVKRFVRGLKRKDPEQYDRLEFLVGEEAQVDYGRGAPTRPPGGGGRYRRPRLFIMTLKYSGRAFRKVVWKSSQETWCRLHEEAFRYFQGCTQYICLDNLKEGVIKPDLYDPDLNPLYAALLKHYQVTADPARVGDSDRKGTVENAVKYTQETALEGRRFESLEAQNDWLRHWEERWAAPRIHGRAKRQVEEMFQEEKPYLEQLPLVPFRYFEQAMRTVYDDGTIQVGNCYYAAAPAPLHSTVVVRIYDEEIELLDPGRMEVIRRHPKSKRPGSLLMEPGERIFNPSRETDRLLAQAERIGPHTFSLCEQWFEEEGRSGQRRMYGLVNLVRHYPARHVEKAAELAQRNGLRSSKALRRMVESLAAEAAEREAEARQAPDGLTQQHPLIRSGEDYGAFWDEHAAQGAAAADPDSNPIPAGAQIISREQLAQVWQQASWLRVIEHFDLRVEDKRRRRDDEIWLKSPFTGEETASLHVSLSENIFKDFSSGQGGGIMQFCRLMLRRQSREMGMFEVAQWMVEQGISTLSTPETQPRSKKHNRPAEQRQPMVEAGATGNSNPAIEIDLRRYLRADHPELYRRGISAATCRYLGCGFLPQRAQAKVSSPLNSRLVFQIRSLRENGHGLEAVIVSHSGRALNREQEQTNGKYWSYPFRKGWELYNQDQLLLDAEARGQVNRCGLILVEGFFDVAKLVEAGCRNVAALMGTAITTEQIERLAWIRTRVWFPHILLFLDRDQAGREAMGQVRERLQQHNLEVRVFDWDLPAPPACRRPATADRCPAQQAGQGLSGNGQAAELIAESIQDPADMPVEQLRQLRSQGII